MLRSPLLLALVTGALALSVAGCGSDTESTTPPAGGDQTGTQPPEAPAAGTPGDGAGVVLAVSKLYLGDTNRDGSPNTSNGWKDYGFNLDRKISTKESTDLCQPAGGGAPSAGYPDGNGGIDNSFGKNILPLLLQSAPTFPAQSNQNIADGSFTVILHFGGLLPAPDQVSVVTQLYGSTPPGAPGGLAAIAKYLSTKVPQITESPAFQQDGLLRSCSMRPNSTARTNHRPAAAMHRSGPTRQRWGQSSLAPMVAAPVRSRSRRSSSRAPCHRPRTTTTARSEQSRTCSV